MKRRSTKIIRNTVLFILILIVSTLSIVSCTSESSNDTSTIEEKMSPDESDVLDTSTANKVKVGVSFGTFENIRFQREAELMENYAEELGNVEVLVQAAESDPALQNTQIENLISQDIDVLLILPQDGKALNSVVEMANSEGIPVIAYDRLIMDSNIDYYISFDSVEVGELMTKYVIEKLGVNEGNFIIVNGSQTDQNAYLVRDGIMNILKPYIDEGKISIISDEFCDNWDGEIAMNNVENALTKVSNDVAAILTSYDGLANGAIQALEEQDLAGKVPVTGQDAELAACQSIVEDKMTLTVYKPLDELAKLAIDSCVKISKGEDVVIDGITNNDFKDVNTIMPEIYVVDKSNMKEIIIDSGFQDIEEVYKNIPKEDWPN